MPVHPLVEAAIQKILLQSPVARSAEISLRMLEPERVVLAMPFSPERITVGTIVHGGMIATLIDIAGAAASASAADMDTKGGATASMTISYLAPADGVDLEAEARVVQRSRGQTVSDVEVRAAGDGRMVAKALVTSRMFR